MTLLALSLLCGLLLAAGLVVNRRGAPAAVGWTLTILATLAAERLTATHGAGARVLAICAPLLLAFKVVVSASHRARGGAPLPALRWLGFALAWPGMDPAPFARPAEIDRRATRRVLRWGVLWVAVGGLSFGAAVHAHDADLLWPAVALCLLGLSLLVHFGAFHLLAAGWRALGVDVLPVFRAPLLAPSLREFWARRWNVGFSEMTAAAVHRPVRRRAGRVPALLASFLFSGVLHELAISVPARGGYGLPTLYFLLHGALVVGERWLPLGTPLARRAWVLGCLLLPLPLLLPPAFVDDVILTLLDGLASR